MAPYFDTTNDLALLPPSVRSHEKLADVAALAELDVIRMFTDAPPYINYTDRQAQLADGIVQTEIVGEDVSATGQPSGAVVAQLRVYLRGYKADAAHANVDPNLKIALKRTVAEVIRWRLAHWNRELGVQSSSDSIGKSRSYFRSVEDAFPPGWGRWLRPFRSDEPCWGF